MAKRPFINAALKTIAASLTAMLRATLAEADLDNTSLQKSIESKVTGGDTVTAYMNDYGRYVISGRRKFVRKVPISALLKWIAEKNIQAHDPKMSANSLAFAIQNAIYKNGIKGRDFITPAVDEDAITLFELEILDALQKEAEAAMNVAVTA